MWQSLFFDKVVGNTLFNRTPLVAVSAHKIQKEPSVPLVGRGGGPSCYFLKIKKVPDFGKKALVDSKNFPAAPFFLVFLTKCLLKCPSFTKPPLPWKISGCVPGAIHRSIVVQHYHQDWHLMLKHILKRELKLNKNLIWLRCSLKHGFRFEYLNSKMSFNFWSKFLKVH